MIVNLNSSLIQISSQKQHNNLFLIEFNLIKINFLSYVLLLSITVLWILVIYTFYEYFSSKLVCFFLNKHLNRNCIAHLLNVNFSSINFSFIYFCIMVKNVNICVTNVCHIELDNLSIRLNNKRTNKSKPPDDIEHYSAISNRLFYAKCDDVRIILFKENFSNFQNLQFPDISIEYLIGKFVFDVSNFSILINRVDANIATCLSVKKFLFAYSKFSAIKSKTNTILVQNCRNKKKIYSKKDYQLKSESSELENLDPCSTESNVESIVINLINLEISVRKFNFNRSKCIDLLCCNLFKSTELNTEMSLTLAELDKARLQIYFGKLPKYVFSNNSQKLEINDPSFMIDLVANSSIKISLDVWHEMSIIFLDDFLVMKNCLLILNRSVLYRAQFEYLFINLVRSNDILYCLSSNKEISTIEILNESNSNSINKYLILNFFLRNFQLKSFLDQSPIFTTKSIYLNTKIEASYINIKLTIGNESNICLRNIGPNLSLINELFARFKSLMNENSRKFDIGLVASLSSIIIELPFGNINQNDKKLIVNLHRVSFKVKSGIGSLMHIFILENFNLSTSLNFFNISNSDKEFLSAKCERVIIESNSSLTDTKIQFIFSPILIGQVDNFVVNKNSNNATSSGTNISTNSYESYLYTYVIDESSKIDLNLTDSNVLNIQKNENVLITSNCLYLNVIQFRYQSFKNQNQTYSELYEIIFGDLFGSIDIELFLQAVNLLSSIYAFIKQELDASSFQTLTEFLPYKSFRLMTSLIHFNVLNIENHFKTENSKMRTILFNLVLSPINFGSCDFHCADDGAGSLAIFSDLSLKIMCSLPNLDFSQKDSITYLDLIECGSFYLKYLSLYEALNSTNQSTKMEYLKSNDNESKRLRFLWNDGKTHECSCTGNSDFFPRKKKNYTLLRIVMCSSPVSTQLSSQIRINSDLGKAYSRLTK